MKVLNIIWLTFLGLTFSVGIGHASMDEDKEPRIQEPLELVLVCPEESKHAGDELPRWVTSSEAVDYFCNHTQETELAE